MNHGCVEALTIGRMMPSGINPICAIYIRGGLILENISHALSYIILHIVYQNILKYIHIPHSDHKKELI